MSLDSVEGRSVECVELSIFTLRAGSAKTLREAPLGPGKKKKLPGKDLTHQAVESREGEVCEKDLLYIITNFHLSFPP